MRILLTNDDGIHAPGFAVLESLAARLSDDVWAVDQARSPALIAAIQQAGSGRQRSDRAFDLALDILVAGIAGLADAG